jgi:hypothetical protein
VRLDELYTPEELERYLWEMANLSPSTTGVERVIIWVSMAQDGAKRHGPRVKVSAHLSTKADPNDLFVMTIQDDPQVVAGTCELPADSLEDVKAWISLNKLALLRHWHGEVTTDELLSQLVKI